MTFYRLTSRRNMILFIKKLPVDVKAISINHVFCLYWIRYIIVIYKYIYIYKSYCSAQKYYYSLESIWKGGLKKESQIKPVEGGNRGHMKARGERRQYRSLFRIDNIDKVSSDGFVIAWGVLLRLRFCYNVDVYQLCIINKVRK